MLLNATLKELPRLTVETARFCREHSLDSDVEFDLNLVLEELFTNTVNHGACAGAEAIAELHLSRDPESVTLDYADRGKPFDPTTAPTPDLTAPLLERPAGGLGIHLIRQIMRDFEYQRFEGWNRLRMRRPLSVEKPK